jgi:hypothetical protein
MLDVVAGRLCWMLAGWLSSLCWLFVYTGYPGWHVILAVLVDCYYFLSCLTTYAGCAVYAGCLHILAGWVHMVGMLAVYVIWLCWLADYVDLLSMPAGWLSSLVAYAGWQCWLAG